jgi:hypothetical protein
VQAQAQALAGDAQSAQEELAGLRQVYEAFQASVARAAAARTTPRPPTQATPRTLVAALAPALSPRTPVAAGAITQAAEAQPPTSAEPGTAGTYRTAATSASSDDERGVEEEEEEQREDGQSGERDTRATPKRTLLGVSGRSLVPGTDQGREALALAAAVAATEAALAAVGPNVGGGRSAAGTPARFLSPPSAMSDVTRASPLPASVASQAAAARARSPAVVRRLGMDDRASTWAPPEPSSSSAGARPWWARASPPGRWTGTGSPGGVLLPSPELLLFGAADTSS